MRKRTGEELHGSATSVSAGTLSRPPRREPLRSSQHLSRSTHYLGIDDYQALVRKSVASVGCFDLVQPIPICTNTNEFVTAIYSHQSVCIEASDMLAQRVTERAREDLIGTSISEVLPASRNWGIVFAQWHQNSLCRNLLEIDLYNQDGTTWTAQVALYPKILDGLLQRFWFVARDITPQTEALHALSSIESHYQAMLNTPDTLSLRIAADGICNYISPASIAVLGLLQNGSLVRSIPLEELVAPNDAQTLLGLFGHTKNSPVPPPPIVIHFKMRDGAVAPFVVRPYPTWSSQGTMESCDIVATRQLSSEMRRTRTGLSSVSNEYHRTIAHDLNNYLMAIRTHLNLLTEATEAPASSNPDSLRVADETLRKCIALTQRFFDTSQDAGRPKHTLDPHQALQDVISLVRPMVPEGIRIVLVESQESYRINADELSFSQIFSNLILNASEALKTSGVIKLQASQAPSTTHDGPTLVRFDVTDDGPGIPPTILPLIFEPHISTKSDNNHHGLGLASVKAIVEQLGGAIRVDSSSYGTTFFVTLPASEGIGFTHSVQAYQPHPHLAPARALRILLADDEPIIRDAIGNILSTMGHSVHAVSDGASALQYLSTKAAEIDVVILDNYMPTARTSDIARRILEIHPEVPVIITSGDPKMSHELRALRAPITFLPKPFTPSDIAEVLTRVAPPRNDLNR
jgi:nitrogen-specific signal transduction histidine kinase